MTVLTARQTAQRLASLRERNELEAERDTLRCELAATQTQLRIVTNERDEARALGRCS